MTTSFKAIDTAYAGHLFRSRLEARWAVIFDDLGVRWEYEKEGFELGKAGRYLPDFWLPDFGVWIEIKGKQATKEEEAKAIALAEASGHPVLIFPCGIPTAFDESNVNCPTDNCDGAYIYTPNGGGDNYYRWCVCTECGTIGITFDGRSDRLPCKECYGCWFNREHPESEAPHCTRHAPGESTGCRLQSSNGDKAYTPGHPRIMRAFDKGRSARFEHGQSGAPR